MYYGELCLLELDLEHLLEGSQHPQAPDALVVVLLAYLVIELQGLLRLEL